jgi:tripartite-type tricarboxylate transporter receptor subunit TctC
MPDANNFINNTLYNNLKFDFIRDVAPVASIGGSAFVLVINPSVPAKTVPVSRLCQSQSGKDQLKKEGSSLNDFQGDRYCRCQSDKSRSAP